MYAPTGAPIPRMGLLILIEQPKSLPGARDTALRSRSSPAAPNEEDPASSETSSFMSSVHSFSLTISLHRSRNSPTCILAPRARYPAAAADADRSNST